MGKHQASKYAKDLWFKLNPPDMYGYYDCALCGEPVIATKVTLDHIRSASIYPELKNDVTNLQPTHRICNEEKGNGMDGGTGILRRYGRHDSSRRKKLST